MVAMILLLFMLLSLDGCGTPSGSSMASDQPIFGTPTLPTSTAMPLGSPHAAAQTTPTGQAGQVMNRDAVERLVIEDLATLLHIPAEQITTLESAERTWPDEGLGCHAPRGIYEPTPTPGYLLRLAYNDQTFDYHTDQTGQFIRCIDPGKPLDPIMR